MTYYSPDHPSRPHPSQVAARKRARWVLLADESGRYNIERDGREVAHGKTKIGCIAWIQVRFRDGDSVVIKDLDGFEQIITRRVANR